MKNLLFLLIVGSVTQVFASNPEIPTVSPNSSCQFRPLVSPNTDARDALLELALSSLPVDTAFENALDALQISHSVRLKVDKKEPEEGDKKTA